MDDPNELLGRMAVDLKVLAQECLDETPLGRPKDSFISEIEPAMDGCCDSVVVWLSEYKPMRYGDFPEENFVSLENCEPLYWGAELTISVWRPCAPTASESRVQPFADNDKKTLFAANIMTDLRALVCCVESNLNSGRLIGGIDWSIGNKFLMKKPKVTRWAHCSDLSLPVLFDLGECC